MSWDIIARALFVDNGAAAGLAKFNSQVHEVAKAAPGGTRAFSMMERGLQTLAFEAAGVSGPLGRVAEGLLKFGGGTGLVLGATVGLGAIAAAYKLSAAEAEALAAAHEKLAATYDQLLARGKPEIQALTDARDAVAKARAEYDKLSATIRGPGGPRTRGSAGEVAQASENLKAAQRNLEVIQRQSGTASAKTWAAAFFTGLKDLGIDEQVAELMAARPEFEKRGAEAADTWRKGFAKRLGIQTGLVEEAFRDLQRQGTRAFAPPELRTAVNRQGMALGGRIGGTTSPGTVISDAFAEFQQVGEETGVILRGLITPQEQFNQAMERLNRAVDLGIISADQRTEAEKRLRDEMGKTSTVRPESFITAGFGLASALASGGSPGGIVSGVGGLIGLSNPIVGAFVGGFGQLLSAGDRHHREAMRELSRIRENTDRRGDPQRTSVTILVNGKEISGAILDDVMYGIRRAERRNAVPVLPPR